MAFIQAERMGWTISEDQFVVVANLDGAVESFNQGHSDLFLWEQHMTRGLVEDGVFRQLGVHETPWPSFVIAVRDEVLLSQTTQIGRIVDAVVHEATGFMDRDDAPEMLASRYGLTDESVKSWMASTTFVGRSAMDPKIPTTVLDTLTRAGFA